MTTYQCNNCGKISSNKSDICENSKEVSSLFICDSCSKHSVSAESICNPVEVKPTHYCGKCGTSAVEESKLCDPIHV